MFSVRTRWPKNAQVPRASIFSTLVTIRSWTHPRSQSTLMPNPDATISVIECWDVWTSILPTTPRWFSASDNVPFTAADEMVVIESITGSGIVSGTVFDDLDQDGVKDNGEVGSKGSLRVQRREQQRPAASIQPGPTQMTRCYSLRANISSDGSLWETSFKPRPVPSMLMFLRLEIGEQIKRTAFRLSSR